MRVAQFSKANYGAVAVFMLAMVTLSFPFLYEGSFKDMIKALIGFEEFSLLVFLPVGLLLNLIVELKITEDGRLICTDADFNWRKTIRINNILEVVAIPGLKVFNIKIEDLRVVYKDDRGRLKELVINPMTFNLKDIAGILKELTLINPNIKLDDCCKSLTNGEYFKEEQEQLQKRREKIKREFNLRRLSKVAGITVLLGIGLIILLVLYILYFSGSN